jgi:hypothetical protein
MSVRPSCGYQTDALSTLSKDNRENRLANPSQNDPPFLAVFAGEVREFKPVAILERLASD